MTSLEQRRKDLGKTLEIAGSMAQDRGAKYTHTDSDKEDRFRNAGNLLLHLSAFLRGSSISSLESAAEREFRLHLAVSTNGLPSYPKLRNPERMPEFDPEVDKYRVRTKWGAFFKDILQKRAPVAYERNFRYPLEETEGVGQLAGELLGELFAERPFTLSIVSGDDIVNVYREAYFGSCMHDPDDYDGARYVDWYAEMGEDTVKMVVLREESGALAARALLWTCFDSSGQRVELLDRIYPGGDAAPHTRFIKEWAKERGVAEWKSEQALEGRYRGSYTVDVPKHPDDGYPYVDSFKYGVEDGVGGLTLHTYQPSEGKYLQFDNTDGTYDTHGADHDQDCYHCDEGMSDDDANTVYDEDGDSRVVCDDCRSARYTYVDGEQSNHWAYDEYVVDHAVAHDQVNHSNILRENAVTLRSGRVTHRDDCTDVGDDDWILDSEVTTLSDGTLVHEDDAVYLGNGETVLRSDHALVEYGGEWHTPESFLEMRGAAELDAMSPFASDAFLQELDALIAQANEDTQEAAD